MIKLEKVNKEINGNHIIKDIDIELVNNGLVFILGPSGSGKTTLLNLMGTLSEVTSGKIIYKEKEISKLNEEEKGKYRNQEIGFIFQEWNLIENISVKENIEISLILQGRKNEEKVEEVMKHLKIWELRDREIRGLSGGEKARVGIARALVKEPKMLLCDEPTGNLDYKTSEEVFKILKEISKEILVIVVSHDEISANKYGSEIITLIDGVITNVEAKEYYSNFDAEANIEYGRCKLKALFPFMNSLLKGRWIISVISLFLVIVFLLFISMSCSLKDIDTISSYKDTLINNKLNNLSLKKEDNSLFTTKETDDTLKKITRLNYKIDYNLYVNNSPSFINFVDPSSKSDFFRFFDNYQEENYLFKEIDEDFSYPIIGQMPVNKNEILISSYLADYIMNLGAYSKDLEIFPKSYEELIKYNQPIYWDKEMFKITGIYEPDYHSHLLTKPYMNKTERNQILKYLYVIYINSNFFTTSDLNENPFNANYLDIELNGEKQYYLLENEFLKEDEIKMPLDNNNSTVTLTINDKYEKYNLGVKEYHLKAIGNSKFLEVSKDLLDKYKMANGQIRNIRLNNVTDEELNYLFTEYPLTGEGVLLTSPIANKVNSIIHIVSKLKDKAGIFIVIGICLLILLIGIIFYINDSLDNHDRKILLMLGASKKQLLKLRVYENIMFSIFTSLISIILLQIIIFIINMNISKYLTYSMVLIKSNIFIIFFCLLLNIIISIIYTMKMNYLNGIEKI